MNYETLKAAVANVIKTNGNEEITGQLLQDVLMAIINALGSGYQFMGIATAETTPGTPDQRVFYLAGSAGSTFLPGFGITVDHEICALMYSDEWEKQTLLQFDSALTSGSQNLVTSGMVYSAITILSQAIDGLAQTVGEHTTAIESLQGTVGDHTTAIEALQETVGGHTTAINNLQYAVVAIQAAIESLQADVAQKIDKSDADSLVVGSAQGMLATSAVEAFFLFQQSGATGDGAALIPTFKGTTKAINQLADVLTNHSGSGITITTDHDGYIKINGTASASFSLSVLTGMAQLKGHTILYGSLKELPLGASWSGNYNPDRRGLTIAELSTSFDGNLSLTITAGTVFNNFVTYYQCVDLTLAGFADYTLAQILALYPNGFGAYNPGVLKNNNAVAMITDGFNQWDEEWLPGTRSSSDGETYAPQSGFICSKNKIPVIGGRTYFVKCANPYRWFFYDKDGSFLSTDSQLGNTDLAIPQNVGFINFQLSYVGGIYNHDICINLSNPAKNGTYEPYWVRKVNFGLDAIKVKSPNIWNEEWEVGGIYTSTGQDGPSANNIRNIGYIPVIGGATYYALFPSGIYYIFRYDANYNYLGYGSATTSAIISLDSNIAYIRFVAPAGITVYGNDITINLSAPGINGKYFPYGEDGILTYNGLDGAGTAFDFIFKDANGVQKLQKTMLAEIDLGDLDYSEYSAPENHIFRVNTDSIPGFKVATSNSSLLNAISAKYQQLTFQAITASDNMCFACSDSVSKRLVFINHAYTDAAAFKAAMAGVKLIAEAAVPAILELAEPIPDMFLTAQGGTMLIVSPEGATAPSAPFSADIIYPVDPIASSGASLKNLLEALKTATVITSYTMTFNSITQQYEFTIVK